MTADAITVTFNRLQQGLVTLLEKIKTARRQPDTEAISARIPAEKQRKIAQALAQTLGYDTASPSAAGRIDETEHPFTCGYHDDVRITTH